MNNVEGISNMYKKILLIASLMLFLASSFALFGTQKVNAASKVDICHATTSVSAPYTKIQVDKWSTNANGHAFHTGPIYPASKWGDIIPPAPTSGVVGGLNWTTAGQAIYNNNCNIPDVAVIPAAVTFTEPTCTDNRMSYTITPTVGVKYYYWDFFRLHKIYVTGTNYTIFSHITIEAEAERGYDIGDGVTHRWTHDFTILSEKDCTVVPAEVTFTEIFCDESGSYIIPTTEGVQYYLGDEAIAAGTYPISTGTTIMITAQAKTGYFLDSEADSEWSHIFKTPEGCTLGAMTTTPLAVTFKAATCEAAGSYTIPTVEGVAYSVDGVVKAAGTYSVSSGTTITVVATATGEYELKEGSVNKWTYTFTALTGCVLGTSTTATTLPTTSGNSTLANVILLSSITGLISMLGFAISKVFVKKI